MTANKTTGLHHITAICSTPKENKHFYTKVLRLYFVKNTVNHDDPSTYHLYYGDKEASPGLLMTFFTWTHLPTATRGVGETSRTLFGVPKNSFGFWKEHLKKQQVVFEEVTNAFNKQQLHFSDPHGLPLGLQEQESPLTNTSTLDKEVAINGFCGVELTVRTASATASALRTLGYEEEANKENKYLFINKQASFAKEITIIENKELPAARQGVGSIHHVAFGIEADKQEEFLQELVSKRYHASPIINRVYFKSIYFREPQGVLFEVATNGPGFYEDEEELGSTFVLPPHLEPRRQEIINNLPPLN
ncbi:MAG: VOC family protein [Candidatus Woesearchaeota archaeon]